MMHKTLLASLTALFAVVNAQSNDTSICNKYEMGLLNTSGNATNQLTLLTLLVNTAVIGNYSPLSLPSGVVVPGILNPNGSYNGAAVNLVPYFSGALNSTNIGGVAGSKNFLDGGGATPLTQNKPADNESSNQYFLLTHLYSFFGLLLGCSEVGMGAYPEYGGSPNMYEVHKFMVLDNNENSYFIQQVALSAASFGVAQEDLTTVGTALNSLFNLRCSPPATVVPSAGNLTQSICTGEGCQLAPNSNCTGQANITAPVAAAAGGQSSGASGSPTSSRATGASGSGGSGGSGSPGASQTSRPASAHTIVAGTALVGAAGALAILFM